MIRVIYIYQYQLKIKYPHFIKSYSLSEIEMGLIELGKLERKQKTKNTIDEADLIQFIGEFVEFKNSLHLHR